VPEKKPTYRELENRLKELEGTIGSGISGSRMHDPESLPQMLLDNFPQRIFFKSPDGVYLWCNRLFAKDAGVAGPEQIAGKTDHDLAWTKEEADQFRECERRVMETNITELRRIESRRCADGEKAWFEVDRMQLYDMDGRITGVLGIYDEISESRKMDLALEESEDDQDSILNTIPDIIYRLDSEGRIKFISNAVKKYGYHPDELVGNSILEIIHPDDREHAIFKINERRTGQRSTRSLEVRILTKEQDAVPFQLNFRSLEKEPVLLISAEGIYHSDKPEHDHFLGTQGIARDITERVRAEQEKEHRNQQLVQADKMISLGVLVAGMAHEINNPNNFIMMNAPILSKAWNNITPVLDSYYRENGDFIVAGIAYSQMRNRIPQLFTGIGEGAERIKNIVQNLKDYARQESSKLNQDVDVNQVLKAALTLLDNLLKKSTEALTVKYSKRLPGVRGNSQRIEQVLINVIQNACQALPDPGRSIGISTRYDEKNKRVIIQVKDKGVGIPEKDIKRILDPFYTTRRDSGGTGLGLSVSAGIIEDHGGRLEFRSKPGTGTTVSIILPVASGEKLKVK
jgi:PAS domain S-box-containing protein